MLMSEEGSKNMTNALDAQFVPLIERYRARLSAHPDHLALAHSDGTTMTRAQLWDAGQAIAEQLTTAGVGARDIVTICLPNRRDWVPIYLAVLQLDAIPATLPSTTGPAALAAASDRIGSRVVITRSGSALLGDLCAPERNPRAGQLSSGSDVLDMTVLDRPRRSADFPAFDQLMFTSGTTGLPRAVMHTEWSLAALNAGLADTYGLDENTPLFMGSPLGHATGVMHGIRLSIFLGAPLLVQEKWDAAQAVEMITEHRAHFSIAATPFLRDFVDYAEERQATISSFLSVFLCGGAPVPSTLVEAAQTHYPEMFVSPEWAMTEGGLTACSPEDPAEKLPTTVGRTRCGLEVVVVDAFQQPCAVGVEGELAMRGPGVFQGYLGHDELYRNSLVDGGYFRTGDLAVLDEDGFVSITGRIKDLIIRGGVNIAPLPIETELAQHPDIARVAVIGRPDRRLGQRICAVVTAVEEGLTLEDLHEWLAAREVPKRQWPESLVVVPAIPMTAAGKVAKHQLSRDLFGKEEG